jgi:hypothetical protein
MKKIIFFNHWHNGDIFAGKGWIQDIIAQYPDLEYGYAHKSHHDVVKDLPAEYIHIDTLPELQQSYKFLEDENCVYVNTWIGSWGWDSGVMLHGEQHANWPSLHRMFTQIYNFLNTHNGMQLNMSPDITEYMAKINWSAYNINPADEFLSQHQGKRLHLFCNGPVRSTQSDLSNMQVSIELAAASCPNDIFICTTRDRWDSELNNIVFTDDIFQQECDINEIAYLSTKCTLIVGKNSGPYMFTHIKENIIDSSKIFISLSHNYSDSYPWQCKGIGCHYIHSIEQDETFLGELFKHILEGSNSNPVGEMIIVNQSHL